MIARANSQTETGQMQRRRGTVDGYRVFSSAIVGDGCFKSRYSWSLGQEIRVQHVDHCIDVGLIDMLTTVGDHGAYFCPMVSRFCSIQAAKALEVIQSGLLLEL